MHPKKHRLGDSVFNLELKVGFISNWHGIMTGKNRKHIIKGDESVSEANPDSINDRRKNTDRRHFTYTFYIPERRSGMDRRDGSDRRTAPRYADDSMDQTT